VENDIHDNAFQSKSAEITVPTAETGGYTTVAATVVKLEELPPDAVVLTVNVNSRKAGLN